jgi:hypothetical protein
MACGRTVGLSFGVSLPPSTDTAGGGPASTVSSGGERRVAFGRQALTVQATMTECASWRTTQG